MNLLNSVFHFFISCEINNKITKMIPFQRIYDFIELFCMMLMHKESILLQLLFEQF